MLNGTRREKQKIIGVSEYAEWVIKSNKTLVIFLTFTYTVKIKTK